MILIEFSPELEFFSRGTSQQIRFIIAPHKKLPIQVNFELSQEKVLYNINGGQLSKDDIQKLALASNHLREFHFENINVALNKLREFLSEDDIEIIDEYFRNLTKILEY